MINSKLIGFIIAMILYLTYIIPPLYNFFNPVGFWQNIAMIFTIDLITYIIFVWGVTDIIGKILDNIF